MERIRTLVTRRPTGRVGALALLAVFWVAQLHGIQHSVSHLGALTGVGDRTAPHALVCADCVASAETGAAPLSRTLELPATVCHTAHESLPTLVVRDRLLVAAYRSRAPPATSI